MQGLISGLLLVVAFAAVAAGAVFLAVRLFAVSGPDRAGGSPDA